MIRGGATLALREFVRATGIPAAETFMGKGLLPYDDPKALGSIGLQAGYYAMAGFEDADVVLAIGYDLVEHSPEHWNPKRDKRIVCIDSVPAETDANFIPEVELVGDLYAILARLGEECRHVPHQGGSTRLREVVLGRFEAARDDDAFPVWAPRSCRPDPSGQSGHFIGPGQPNCPSYLAERLSRRATLARVART